MAPFPGPLCQTTLATLDSVKVILVLYSLNRERLLMFDLSIADLVSYYIAVQNLQYGRWASNSSNTCALRCYNTYWSHCGWSGELCEFLPMNVLYAMQYLTAISSLHIYERFWISAHCLGRHLWWYLYLIHRLIPIQNKVCCSYLLSLQACIHWVVDAFVCHWMVLQVGFFEVARAVSVHANWESWTLPNQKKCSHNCADSQIVSQLHHRLFEQFSIHRNGQSVV